MKNVSVTRSGLWIHVFTPSLGHKPILFRGILPLQRAPTRPDPLSSLQLAQRSSSLTTKWAAAVLAASGKSQRILNYSFKKWKETHLEVEIFSSHT